jgi:hypothetical protein
MDNPRTIPYTTVRADVNHTPPTNNIPGAISVSGSIIPHAPNHMPTINPTLHTTNDSLISPPVTITQTQQSNHTYAHHNNINETSTTNVNDTISDEIITVHHEDKVYSVLSYFCLPVNQTPLNDNYVCKFPNRDCVMKRCKIFQGLGSKNLHQLSETVFSPPTKLTGTLKYLVVDSRIIKCCQPACTNGLDSNPKLFHFSCYMHSFLKSDNKGMSMVSVTSENDKVLNFLNIPEAILIEVKTFLRNGNSVLFPCCGKRCYKVLAASRLDKKKSATSSSTAISETMNNTNPNWDKDGSTNTRSSIQILIDWLTTEENATKYFGGLDKDGRTSSDRKESYHNYISEIIKNENGE